MMKGQDMTVDTSTTSWHLEAETTSDERDTAAQALTSFAAGDPVVLDSELTAAARGRVAALVAQLMPPLSSVMPRGSVLQAHRNAEARVRLAERYGVLTSTQLAERSGSRATNPAATANRWRTQGKVFSVTWDGVNVYPGFQLDEEGQTRPVIAQVIDAAGDQLRGWDLALWFTSSNAWLDGARPVDLLDESPADVLDAVRSAVVDVPE